MTTKIIAAIVAAVGLGFAGTYFATGSGGSCSDGGCPISRMLGLSSNTSADVAAPACPSCCSSKVKAECCDSSLSCCESGGKCSAGKDTVKIIEPTGVSLPVDEK